MPRVSLRSSSPETWLSCAQQLPPREYPASRCRLPGADTRWAASNSERQSAYRHARLESCAGLRRRERHHHRGRRDSVATAAGTPRIVQTENKQTWGIYQKQTGADRLSVAGAFSCNAHGRGLDLAPIVQQVEHFDLLDARGERAHLFTPGERGSFPARDWRLRALRHHHTGPTQVETTGQGAACRRARRNARHHGPFRGTHSRGLSVRRLPIYDRRRP